MFLSFLLRCLNLISKIKVKAARFGPQRPRQVTDECCLRDESFQMVLLTLSRKSLFSCTRSLNEERRHFNSNSRFRCELVYLALGSYIFGAECTSVGRSLSEDEASAQSSRLIPFCCAKWMKWKPSGRQGVVDVISANTDRQIEQHLKAANSQTSLDGERKNAENVGFMIKLNPHNDAFVPTDADWRTQNKQSTTRIHPGLQI